MSRRAQAAGKFSAEQLERQVLRNLGARRSDVRVGPSNGVDVGILGLPGGRSLVLTTDPLYVDPALGWADAAWFAFHIVASDYTTCGSAPQFITVDLNLPPGTTDQVVGRIMSVFSKEAKLFGATILTGHTGRYESCSFPVVGGATFGGVVPKEEFVVASMARPGDDLLLTKGPAFETGVLLARMFPRKVERALGTEVLQASRRAFHQLSTVKDALVASRSGLRGSGVWAMHDATEGGVRNALEEMAVASGCGLELDLSGSEPSPFVAQVCELFHVDLMSASSEGSLLVAVDPSSSDRVLQAWRRAGIAGQRLGRVGRRGGPVRDRGRKLSRAQRDGFWPAVQRARRTR